MYLRYFLWNFAGREGDVQFSNWLAPWEPVSLENTDHNMQHARNQYWMIPLLLGTIGSIYHYRKNRHAFISILIFFLTTGVVLVLYLNSPPNEPRERDYIYVGSYIAFSWWIGLGILALFSFMNRWKVARLGVVLVSLAVPLWMYLQNHDDHDRSGRTFQIDHARNVLQSCAPNAILFTGGDNDTFPLWYLQEVEGFRTDVRVMVLSYFNTDWYIDQLRNTYYQSSPFKLMLPEKSYRQYGPNDVLYLQESIREGIDATRYLTLLRDEHPALRMPTSSGDVYSILPSRTIRVPVDKDKFTGSPQKHFVSHNSVTDELMLTVTGDYLPKNALAFLDLLISNQWERPIYFNFTSLNTFDLDLKPYMVQEGQLYHLLPIQPQQEGIAINTTLMYKNLVEQADYSNLADSSVYFNYEDYQLRMIIPLQQTLNTLAEAFYEEGNLSMAEKVLLTSVDKLYHDHFIPSITNLQAAHMLMALGKDEFAFELSQHAFQFYYRYAQQRTVVNSSETDAYMLRRSAAILSQLGYGEYQKQADALLLAAEY
jgi:cadmium resistance protein CadD (predicted permease)